MNIERLIEVFERVPDRELGVGASIEQITTVEAALGFRLRGEYREFLLRLGWARLGHRDILGIGTEVPIANDLVATTTIERRDAVPALPGHLVPVMADGAGNHYCLDMSAESTAEPRVVFWDHEFAGHEPPETVAVSFAQWLVELIEG